MENFKLKSLDQDLWIVNAPLRFFGLEMGARMTVVRLPGSQLLLISPVAANAELVKEVRALGSVSYLVAPNCLHHLFIGEWKAAFPEAAIYMAAGLERKRPDLNMAALLSNSIALPWSESVEHEVMVGFSVVHEVVFFHRPSKTLIMTDLAFNIGPRSPLRTRMAFRLLGAYGRLSISPVERFLIRDRQSFKASLERVLAWPFERVIVAHGEVLEEGGREGLLRSYSWLL